MNRNALQGLTGVAVKNFDVKKERKEGRQERRKEKREGEREGGRNEGKGNGKEKKKKKTRKTSLDWQSPADCKAGFPT